MAKKKKRDIGKIAIRVIACRLQARTKTIIGLMD